MTKKPESKFGQKLMACTKAQVHWTRIESWALPGVPDLHGISQGIPFWLELKVTTLLNAILTSANVGARPHQIQWQNSYSRAGGLVRNLVLRPSSKSIVLALPFPIEGPLSIVDEFPYTDEGLRDAVETLVKSRSS